MAQKTDLSILIPARNEVFLKRTVEDILKNLRGNTEIIVVLDGAWADPGLDDHERVRIIYNHESIGQRAAINQAARLSQSKWVMKADAHCAFGEGFDVKILEGVEDDWTVVPTMYNLHAFDWICKKCGNRTYQGPTPTSCTKCDNTKEFEKDILWKAKQSPESTSMRFDRNLIFKYWSKYKKRQSGNLVETMSILGACFMLTRKKFWELDICDEKHGSWGQQGTEVACKTWLSGGKLICNKKTWFSHLFRTQGGDFGFPYHLSGRDIDKARKYSRDLWFNSNWPKAKHSLRWLIDKFAPIEGWHDQPDVDKLLSSIVPVKEDTAYVPKPVIFKAENAQVTKEIIYYTCNTHEPEIDDLCRKQLLKAANGIPIVAVSLNKDLDFGNERIRVDGERSPIMLHKQALLGLQRSKADVTFLCESDVLYHPSHFEFNPKRDDVFYFNTNVWKMRWHDGHFVWTDDLRQLSGMVASRKLMTDFFTKRLAQIEKEGFNKHYEPSNKQNIYPYVRGGKYGEENFKSRDPNVCIRHDSNITKSKWSVDDFNDKGYSVGWKEADEAPFWGKRKDIISNV